MPRCGTERLECSRALYRRDCYPGGAGLLLPVGIRPSLGNNAAQRSPRTGRNLAETLLNTTNVRLNTFGKLFTRTVDGQIYAQPLYVARLMIGGQRRNVVFVATQNDSVYAFDADNAAASSPLWHTRVGTPMPNTDIPGTCVDIHPQIGVTSTPVIDTVTNTIYVVAKTNTLPITPPFQAACAGLDYRN